MAEGEERDISSSNATPPADVPRQSHLFWRADSSLLLGRYGRWRWPWAVAGTLTLGAGAYLTLKVADAADNLIALPFGDPLENMEFIAGRPDSFSSFLTYALALIAPTLVALVVVHRVSWRAALGPDGRFQLPLFWRSAGAIFTVYVASALITYAREPQNFSLQPKPITHVFWLALAALVILPQAFAEELVFKGYLTRVWGAVLPSRAVIVSVVAAVFTWLHADNDDIKVDLWFNLISFAATELLIFVIYLRTMSLDAVTGLHWMNNVISFCLLTTVPGSALAFAMVKYTDPVLSAGGTYLTDPEAWGEMLLGLIALWTLLTWRRSPFRLPSRTA